MAYILMYHNVDAAPSVLSVSPQAFEGQMRQLAEGDFQVLPLSELARRLRERRPLPDRAVSITFDDGFEGVYRHAFPVLKQFGFPATVFLAVDYCSGKNDWPGQPAGIPRLPLSGWEQITEMSRCGIEIGSHTATHPRLDQLDPGRLESEIVGSKQAIAERLGHDPALFAYPYGRYHPASLALVRQAYLAACSTRPGPVRIGDDPHTLSRVEIAYLAHPKLFQALASPLLPVYLAQRRRLRQAAGIILKRAWA